jgi:hypothetical protein
MRRLFTLLLFVAAAANAQVVATAGRGYVVAHDDRVELFDEGARRIWTADGVDMPSGMAIGSDRVAVIDSFHNAVRIYDLANGRAERIATGETPVDARFVGRDLYVLDRDASRIERIGGGSLAVASDPAFMRVVNGRIYVYSRLDGIVQEIDSASMRVTRSVTLGPFASAFEMDGRTGYLLYPRDAKLRTFALATMRRGADIAAGAVPVDLAIASRSSALSASRLVIADPSAKRVSVVEGSQSIAAAVARGFIRGLLGLGLFRPRSSTFPTGVDRVATRGTITVAYDSTTKTLYRVKGSNGAPVARELGPDAFAIGDGVIAVWQNGALRLIR